MVSIKLIIFPFLAYHTDVSWQRLIRSRLTSVSLSRPAARAKRRWHPCLHSSTALYRHRTPSWPRSEPSCADLLPICLVLGNAAGSSATRHRPPGSPMLPPRTCPGSSTSITATRRAGARGARAGEGWQEGGPVELSAVRADLLLTFRPGMDVVLNSR
jgi:hypothetical protein